MPFGCNNFTAALRPDLQPESRFEIIRFSSLQRLFRRFFSLFCLFFLHIFLASRHWSLSRPIETIHLCPNSGEKSNAPLANGHHQTVDTFKYQILYTVLLTLLSLFAAMEAPLEDTLNRHWKNDKSRFGFKMLQKMGWSEDKGLGKDESGVVNAVKVTKKAEGLGLGMTMDSSGNSSWGSTASSFNDVLQLLQESYGASSPKKKKSKAKSASIKVGVK